MPDQPFEVISDGEEGLDDAEEELEEQLENGGIRKNLLGEFADIEKTNSNVLENNGRECMKVYLRIRPFSAEEKDLSQDQDCMEIDGDSAINLNAPKDSFTFKNEKRGREVTHRFTFSRVFGPETTQKQFFDDTNLNLLKDFMDGQNCLVFTYGITNSGKTYTIQGTPKDGGILPRTLDVLFNSIQNKQYPRMNLKPRYFCDVVKINEKQEHMEGALRNGLLMSLNKEQFDLNSFLQLEDSNDFSKGSIIEDSLLQASLKSQDGETTDHDITEDEDTSRLVDNTTLSVDAQGPVKFSVWISFAEIYNELIFDLLEPCPEGKGKKRVTLKLGDDKNGNPYVKGLREVCVSSADEAYKILRVGKKNQRISATKLNQASSRSHCIFTIKVLRVVDVENPHAARVSRLSFVDLAGSERYTKTQNTGDRLKEAGNINTSLMTLGKCLDCLRYNQLHQNHPQIIPFRESKLTRLFQGFFCGKGKASMIVNINQCAATFDETYHALKFSAIAKQVTTKVCKPSDMLPPVEKSFRASFAFPVQSKAARMSIPWENGALSTPAGGRCERINEDEEEDEENDVVSYQKQLENLVRVLQEQLIEEKKSKAMLEVKIREEVCGEMAEQLVAIESAYSERIQEEVTAVEEKCERRIELLAKSIKKTRKRARIEKQEDEDEEWVPSVQLHAERVKVEELTAQVNELKSAIEEDENRFKAQEEIMMDLQSALETSSKELELAKIKLDKRDELLKEKDEAIRKLEKDLDVKNDEELQECESKEKSDKIVQNLYQEIEKLQSDLEQQQTLVKENSNALEKSKEMVSQLEESVTEKDAILEEKMVLLDEKNDELKNLENNERELEEKARMMTESLEKGEKRVKELEQNLEEKENLLVERTDLLEKQETLVKKLRNNIKEHEEALENNESFLGQLNDTVRQLSHELVDAKNKEKEKEKEHEKENEEKCSKEGLETALASKLANLREQLLARDELMKELVQSLEETREQVELDKGDLVMLNNKQKIRIVELEDELETLKKAVSEDDSDKRFESLKEQLKKAETDSIKAKEQMEMSGFEKEEIKCALDDAKTKEGELKNQIAEAKQEVEELKKCFTEAKENISSLEKTLESKNTQLMELQTDAKKDLEMKNKLGASNKRQAELERQVKEQESELKTTLSELEELKTEKVSLDKAKLEIEKLSENLATKELRVKELVNELEDVKNKLQQENKENSKASEEGNDDERKEKRSDAKNKDKTKEIKELEKQLEVTTRALDKKNSQLISRNNALKRLELSLSEKEAKISELTKEKGQGLQTPSKDLRTREEIRTLRRRVVQADKDTEELKQKVQEYQSKFEEVSKQQEEKSKEVLQLQEKLEVSENRVKELENNFNDVKEESLKDKEKLEANEKKIEVYRLQQSELKEKTEETAKLLEQMKEEIENAKNEKQEKIKELEDVKNKAELYEKRVEELNLQQSENVKESDERVTSLMEKLKSAEEELKRNVERLQMLEESKEREINQLQERIQFREKQLEEKEETVREIGQKSSEAEKEKSEELDKVWKTLVEHQAIIRERGENIDDLENKLTKAEARHAREKATLENTVAKMKEVMESEGGDRKKQMSRITELEGKAEELQKMNDMLISASEQHEKEMNELKKVLDEQDAVMEEQEKALNERQNEIESLLNENGELLNKMNTKENCNESTTAEIRRLEGTLAVYIEEKERLEKEVKEIRQNDQQIEISKVEISRDHEKEKTDILVKLEQKEGVIGKLKTQLKSAQSEANKEKKSLQQKAKDLEAEINKLTVRLQVVEGKKQEYEDLCQLKDADVRAANEEKEETLKVMRQALAIAAAKKDEYQAKLEAMKKECTAELEAKHEREIEKLREEFEGGKPAKKMPDLKIKLNKIEVKTKRNSTECEMFIESPTNKKEEKTNKSASSQDEDSTTEVEDGKKAAIEPPAKERANNENSSVPQTSGLNMSVKSLKDETLPEGRIEIDVTPIKRRKRTSRAPSKTTSTKKRRSSELPLSEIKNHLKARKQMEQSEDEFTPGSVKLKERPKRSTRKTRANSTACSSSTKGQRPPVKPLSPMNENKETAPEGLKKQSSIKKKRFLGKLFSNKEGEENTPPPKKGRKLLKKDISAPMDNFSPCISGIDSIPKSNEKTKAHSIISRQLRSRAIKF
ncbi:kinesin-like protein KIF20B [Actinia tenebrosa]|uniref:Kinesin-like protein KIF20B n=1 Tax=Actinia tenebrosa TaxID=6105 RepID=A0A6P8HJH1_ACTTE|nr:kinesin-like protein KIF20B [Actinia tenebrosa]